MTSSVDTRTSPRQIDGLGLPSLDETPAATLRRIRTEAPALREWLRGTGTVSAFHSCDLVTLPYPTRFALWEASSVRVPYVWMTNRMFVIQWRDGDRLRTLLSGPSDVELGIATPYLQHALDRLPLSRERALKLLFPRHGTVGEHLARLGIAADDVDYVVFDHLHTQDIRRVVGTTRPAPDLGYADRPVPPMFPRAELIVQRSELAHVKDVHPFQARFHQSDSYADLDESRFLEIDGSALVAPGLALVRTPGHTLGNNTLVVNTEDGVLTSSENGVAVECYSPEHSRLPGVAKWAAEWGYEVVLNFNTPEFASWQYNAMVAEKLMSDPLPGRPELPFVVPSSELTTHRLAPRVRPTFQHGALEIGRIGAAS
jgi:hypothetical protein